MAPTGRTKDVGWECGVRRTFAGVGEDEAWALLRSAEGLELWLGGAIALEPARTRCPTGRPAPCGSTAPARICG